MPVHVTSEIGRLQAVLVHSPGTELLAVTPSTREDYLFDDVIDAELAATEHRRFVAILERFCRVHHVGELLTDVVANAEARELLVRETMDIVPSQPLGRELKEMADREIVRMLIEGKEQSPGPFSRTLNDGGYELPPLPNLFFTRDTAMCIDRQVMIGSMRYGIRWSEELILKTLFLYHPELANDGILYDGSMERRYNYTLEGGDVQPLRSDAMLIGFSERTSPAAVDALAALLFERTPVTDIIIVVMPKEMTAIHLDMIFSQIDRELAVVYPPLFIGPERLSVLHWRKGQKQLREMPNIFTALQQLGLPMEPVFCGGEKRSSQEREQWASGCNFVALRPGVVLSYARNEETLRELDKMGFSIVPSVALLTGQVRIAEGQRAVITFEGNELVRGGGGPRCMTCPVSRDDPWD